MDGVRENFSPGTGLERRASEALQVMPLEDLDDYEKVISYFETRYRSTHSRQVHHIELKNRNQKISESLQKYEMVIACLTRKAYLHLPDGELE